MKKEKENKNQDQNKFLMEAGARFVIRHMAETGMINAEDVANAIQEYIKNDVRDGNGNKFL